MIQRRSAREAGRPLKVPERERRPMFGAEDRVLVRKADGSGFEGRTSAPEFKVPRSLSLRLFSRDRALGGRHER
jgi:hypothetical protein